MVQFHIYTVLKTIKNGRGKLFPPSPHKPVTNDWPLQYSLCVYFQASGNLPLITALLMNGSGINSLTRIHRMTLLEIAIRAKQGQVAKWLVKDKGFRFFSETLQCSSGACLCGESACKQRLGNVFVLLKRCINRGEWENADLCIQAGVYKCELCDIWVLPP